MKDKEINIENFFNISTEVINIEYENKILFKNLNDFLKKYIPGKTEGFYMNDDNTILFIFDYDSNIMFVFIYDKYKKE